MTKRVHRNVFRDTGCDKPFLQCLVYGSICDIRYILAARKAQALGTIGPEVTPVIL